MSAVPAGWSRREFSFVETSPIWRRDGPHPEAPLVILCHGMGEAPEDWHRKAPQVLALPAHLLLPAGPYPHEVRSDSGRRIGHAWYLYDGGLEPFAGTLSRSEAWLTGAVERTEKERGWHPRQRVLLGYSQGAYFAFVTALRRSGFYSHLLAVAGRLKAEFVQEELRRGGPLRTLIVHGDRDRAVDPRAAASSRDTLARAGFAVELLGVPSGHAFTPEIDARCAAWITRETLAP